MAWFALYALNSPGSWKPRTTGYPIQYCQLKAIMSSLTLNACYSGDWECTTCCSDYNTIEGQPWQAKDESLVCAACIIRCFELGLENDYTWPARFGPDVLHSQD